MNLSNSILTSLVVVVLFWGCALFQSNIAAAFVSKDDAVEIDVVANKAKPQEIVESHTVAALDSTTISGVTEQLLLANIPQLWQRFNADSKLHNKLTNQPNKVYVLYRGFSNNYQQANVTIGYDVTLLNEALHPVVIDTRDQAILLVADQYSEAQLAAAWNKIDYQASLQYVLEVHSLNPAGETTSTQLYVSYK